jgi:uncharacterized protein
MRPGRAAVCAGKVFHRRTTPALHEFTNPVGYVWLDPDRPDDLCRSHPLWSSTRPSPARFRRHDYGLRVDGSLADSVRDDLASVLGERPAGSVRMLTQVRRCGWLFNPITVYLAWTDDECDPAGAVLEVTNTPWKERVRYPVPLWREGQWLIASTDKVLHVSPFLDESHRYDLRLRGDDGHIEFGLDVVPDGMEDPIVVTGLTVERVPATRSALTRALFRPALSTHRVSWGIHWQALRLWLKRVPFVPHPRKREVTA